MKVAILITARLKSTRLRMKVIKPIMGRPMIGYMLDRLKLAKKPEKIIICTSRVSQDDPLEEIAEKEAVLCFRGHADDVLLRLTEASKQFGVDVIISCTADNPFVDPVYIDRLADFHIKEGNDYSNVRGLPFGTFSYALSRDAMIKACEIKATEDTEFWVGYFTKTGMFKVGTFDVEDPEIKRPELRLTVDTQEDFDVITAICSALHKKNKNFSLHEIVSYCDNHPGLMDINKRIEQKSAKSIYLKS